MDWKFLNNKLNFEEREKNLGDSMYNLGPGKTSLIEKPEALKRKDSFMRFYSNLKII